MHGGNYYFYINLFALGGLAVSLYSYVVKKKFNKDPKNFKALCDINEHMSCTRVLTSEYGSGFGIAGKLFGKNSSLNISNSILGGVFYLLQIILTFYHDNSMAQSLALYSSITSIIGSIYLAYILYFVLKDFCVVCNISYVVNAFIFYYNCKIHNLV